MEFLDNEFDEILDIFKNESDEILQRIDQNLLLIEKDPLNKEILMTLFREAHSLKGSLRMLGFNNIQNIAHKIEDVLGLAKDGRIKIISNVADTLSSAIQYISLLIKKTVSEKKEVYTQEITNHLDALDEITGKPTQARPFVIQDGFTTKVNEINAVLTEAIFIFTKAKSKPDISYRDNLMFNFTKLVKLFETIELSQERELALELAKKLENITFTTSDFDFLNEKINALVSALKGHFKEKGVNNIDYFLNVASKIEEQNSQKKEQGDPQVSENSLMKENCLWLEQNILNLENDLNLYEGFKIRLSYLVKNAELRDLKIIYRSIANLLETLNIKKAFDIEVLKALKQIFVSIIDCTIQTNISPSQDLGLIMQRLTILSHVAELSEKHEINEGQSQPVQVVSEDFNKDWYKVFDQSSIKMLRVDSSKLDKLVNHVAELIITKIKYSEHAIQVQNLNRESEEMQKEAIKMLNYMKYFDRKYLSAHHGGDCQSFALYNKQLISMINENLNMFSKVTSRISFLYKQYVDMNTKLDVISNEVEDTVKNMRILPLATILHMFPRMVRNISKDEGKEVNFQIVGSETSADKKIIEEIKISLMHIVRNSIGHGIETPKAREMASKPTEGRIVINAKHQQSKVVISVEDDGAGIDVEKIKAIAVKKGFLSQDEIELMDEAEIMNLIFYPGFSTGEKVDNISGRGLGLDIVKTKIMQLDGKIDVISKKGEGTIVKIELPATMATFKAFILEEGGAYYAIAMNTVKKVLLFDQCELFQKDNKSVIIQDSETIYVYELSRILDLKSSAPVKKNLIILEHEGLSVGIIVEKLVNDQEILYKKLSPPLLNVKNIQGITTLASGETCLILNVLDILKANSHRKSYQRLIEASPGYSKNYNSAYKIMIVDDSLTTRTLERNILQNAGYEVILALDGLDALNKLKDQTPDLILTDNEMPKMNGVEFVSHLKENPKTAQIPVIVVTSLGPSLWEDKFIKLGVDKFIQKSSFDQITLLEQVRSLIRPKYDT